MTGPHRRVLPQDYDSAAEIHSPPGGPVVESTWVEPYPDVVIGLPAGLATPEACYEQQEAIELAFVAAIQHLAPSQRAVLLLREVLGFNAQEVADLLETTVPAVTSALQRARVAVRERVPAESQQATLATLGEAGLRDLVGRYVEAWERCDVDAFVALLAEDATFAMPPLSTWYTPRDSIAAWARETSLSGAWRWRVVLTRANAQPALAFYAWDGPSGAYLPFALNVLSVHGRAVRAVTAFVVRSIDAAEPEAYVRFPEQPINAHQMAGAFGRFDLPDHLNAD
jgi:RNA polymerase sigma-70 factor (ECF subfamily)